MGRRPSVDEPRGSGRIPAARRPPVRRHRLLVECIRAVHAGKYWLEKNVTTQALETVLRQQAGARRLGDLLTDREIEITCAVANGLRNKAIADRLNISEGTVKVHLHNATRSSR